VPAQLTGRTLENRLVDTQVASGTRTEPVNLRARTGDPLESLPTKTVQNAAQKPAACLAKPCVKLQMGDTGLELCPYSPRNTRISKKAAQNPTHCAHQTLAISPELQRVIDAWPALPAAVRHGLLTIIDAIGGDPDEAPR